MKKIKYWALLILVMGAAACEKFEEMNTNPNEPTEVPGEVLLPSAIRQSVNTSVDAAFLISNNAAQLTAKTLRTEVDAYNWNAFPKYWDGWYTSLTDVSSLRAEAASEGNDAMEGVARILQSYIMANITNVYGDVPYQEAIQGVNNNFTPAYDNQEDIYEGLLSDLDTAVTLLSTGEGAIGGDILLGNDASRWVKFANSLSLRLIMTAGNKLPNAGSRFSQIVATGNIISSNDDNVVLQYTGSAPNQFPLITLKIGDIDAVAISEAAVDFMEQFNDPRLSRYARPNTDDFAITVADSAFKGAVNGPGASCGKDGASRLGVQYYDYPNLTSAESLGLSMADGIVMTYAEVSFLLAEATAKGWISKDPIADLYEQGIEASHEYYQVDYTIHGYNDFADFYSNSGVAYSDVKDIWAQKWLALFFSGVDAYVEVRRWYNESGNSFAGIPFLEATCNNQNSNQLPLRFLYPGEEQSLNSENYQEALARIGGTNSQNATMWILQ